MSQPTFLTTGDEVLDRELADLRRLVDNLSARVGGTVSAGSTTTIIEQPFTPPSVAQTIYITEPVLNGTSGSLLYVDSRNALAQDNTNLFYDATNKRVGLGTNAPTSDFHIQGNVGVSIRGDAYSSAAATDDLQFLFTRGRGTKTVPVDVINGDFLGHVIFRGFISPDNVQGVAIRAAVDVAPSSTGCPSRLIFLTSTPTTLTECCRMDSNQNTGFGVNPTARVHITAGAAAAHGAPFKIDAGTNLTSPEAGAIEWDGTNLYVTQTTGPTRKTIAFTSDVPARGCLICLCAAFTPAGTGADVAEFVIPYSPADGTTSITWNVRRIDFRVQTAGGAPSVRVEKSTGSGAFSASTVGDVTLGSGASEGNNTTSLGTVASGNKIRFNVLTLATATGWTVEVTLGA